MAVHIIENGIVTNTIVATVDEALAAFPMLTCIDATIGGSIGESWDGVKFTPPPIDLTALKAAKNSEINAARLAANFSTFPHAGKAIACDQLSRSDIDGTNGFVSLYGALPPGWPGGWKAVDNTYVPISSVDGWKAFYSSMFAAGNANFAKAQALKTQLEAAATAAEVAAVVW